MEDERDTTTLRSRRKKNSGLNLSCFSGHSSDPDYHRFSSPTTAAHEVSSPHHFLSPSSWFRSKPSSASSHARHGRRRHHSADFSYDALSYSLNFDDGHEDVGSPMALPRRQLRDLELPPGRRGGIRSAAMSPLNRSAGTLPMMEEVNKSTLGPG